jgi:F0F1-type ATP synthase membrane subunit b/b'
MTTNTKLLIYGSLGVAIALLLTSDKTKDFREDMIDAASRNAKKLKKQLSQLGVKTTNTLDGLREMLDEEVEGLSSDARKRIESILDKAKKDVAKVKDSVTAELS